MNNLRAALLLICLAVVHSQNATTNCWVSVSGRVGANSLINGNYTWFTTNTYGGATFPVFRSASGLYLYYYTGKWRVGDDYVKCTTYAYTLSTDYISLKSWNWYSGVAWEPDPLIVSTGTRCPTAAAAVNCVGTYVPTSACTKTCGGGTQTATYQITTPPANGGAACPFLQGQTTTLACNTAACPVNCVGTYVPTSACTKTCGGGTQTATYQITTPPANGGAACPFLQGQTTTLACNTAACPKVFTDIGLGACNNTYIWGGYLSNFAACQAKCPTFSNCGGISYGWANSTWCSITADCTSLDKRPTGCGSSCTNGVRGYRYAPATGLKDGRSKDGQAVFDASMVQRLPVAFAALFAFSGTVALMLAIRNRKNSALQTMGASYSEL